MSPPCIGERISPAVTVDGKLEKVYCDGAPGNTSISEESAETYIKATDLDSDWKTFCPGRTDLLEILRQSTSVGIDLAVLDPNAKEAKRIFDLCEVVKTMQE